MTEDSFRTSQLRKQLETAQSKLKTDPDRKTELQAEKLEGLIEAAERNDEARTERMAELAKAEQAKVDARQEQQQVAIEQSLRAEYNRALPTPVTDSEWDKVKADVFHQHRLRTMNRTDELVAATARRYKI